jgi:hypothetical protein
VTATYARGFTFLLKANVNVGSSNVEVSRLRQLRGLTTVPDPPAFDIRFLGRNADDEVSDVTSAGDVNGDGYNDLLIGSNKADGGGSASGEVYLILSRSTANWESLTDVNGDFNLDNMSKANLTVRFIGRNSSDEMGVSISSAGDVNGDGYDDILLGAHKAGGGGGSSGEAYLLFGRSTTDWNTLTDASGNFNLDNLSKANKTVRFIGRNGGDTLGIGYSMSSAGDVNGDGYDDLLMGAESADGGGSGSGEAYLIFGRITADWDTLSDASGNFNLDNMSKANKTVLFLGRESDDYSGYSVSSAGDVNNDGYDDLLISGSWADGGGSKSGEAYLIFGRITADWDSLTTAGGDFDLSNMSKANKTVRFLGRNSNDELGTNVSSAGDMNNDGYDDLLLAAYGADGGGSNSGEAYLIFGRSTADWDTLSDASGNFNLDNLSKANKTVCFIGRNSSDYMWNLNSNAGDVNNDGYDDLLLGTEYASSSAGEAYLIFGRSTADWDTLTDASGNFNLDNLSKANLTVRFLGRNGNDNFGNTLSVIGDVNDDGFDDLLMGARKAGGGASKGGEVYLIFGRSTARWATFSDASGNYNLDDI